MFQPDEIEANIAKAYPAKGVDHAEDSRQYSMDGCAFSALAGFL